jgi:hypothetical protein
LQHTLALEGQGTDGLSYDAALSYDGNIAVLGAAFLDCEDYSCGTAYVFARALATWSLQQQIARPAEAHLFGASVDLSGDGETALIAAPGTEGGGAVYGYERSGAVWSLQKKFTLSDSGIQFEEQATFGVAVALSGDGNTCLIGAFNLNYEDPNEIYFSGALAFSRNGDSWTEQGVVADGDGYVAHDRMSLDLSGDGSAAIMAVFGGYAWSKGYRPRLFERLGAVWNLKQTLEPAGGWGDDALHSGSVALSVDAHRALIGDYLKGCGAGVNCGEVHYFAADLCIAEGGLINPKCLGILLADWIPVGCEIIDCCPECPGFGAMPIDWLVRVDGDPFDEIVLRFENLHPTMQERLRIEGKARWLGASRLEIQGRGEVAIRGFSLRAGKDLRQSTFSPRMTLERVLLAGGSKGTVRQPGQGIRAGGGAIRIRVEQMVGEISISNSSLVFRY